MPNLCPIVCINCLLCIAQCLADKDPNTLSHSNNLYCGLTKPLVIFTHCSSNLISSIWILFRPSFCHWMMFRLSFFLLTFLLQFRFPSLRQRLCKDFKWQQWIYWGGRISSMAILLHKGLKLALHPTPMSLTKLQLRDISSLDFHLPKKVRFYSTLQRRWILNTDTSLVTNKRML